MEWNELLNKDFKELMDVLDKSKEETRNLRLAIKLKKELMMREETDKNSK